MSVKPFKPMGVGRGINNLHVFSQRTSLQTQLVIREAEKIEDLLKKLLYSKVDVKDAWDICAGDISKLRNLNNFGKQIATQMLRSNLGCQGFKVEFKDPALKPDVLFLLGTLCSDFDPMHTSPLYGLNILDIGCGSLSPYATSEKNSLVDLFYSDHPPIAAELLQILGAHTVGVDPRPNNKQVYTYSIAYKHRTLEFPGIGNWLTTLDYLFDVVSCLSLFSKSVFSYHYSSPQQIAQFLGSLKCAIAPQGLLYTTPPLIPSSLENKQTNHAIFHEAGFRIVYEGYYFILQPI